VPGTPPSLAWPGEGEAAVGIEAMDVLETSPAAKPLPTASVAKVMTALLTLEARPLSHGQAGPELTVTEEDVATYEEDLREGQSVVGVTVGELLTEYQALQALLLPSANNIATLLAPGGYLAAASDQVPAGPTVLIVVALQGQPSLTATGEGPPGAFDAARSLLESVRSALKQVRLVSRGQAVGRYRTPWGGGSEILAAADLDSVVWPGRPVVLRLFARGVRPPLAGGSAGGRLDVSANGGLQVVP